MASHRIRAIRTNGHAKLKIHASATQLRIRSSNVPIKCTVQEEEGGLYIESKSYSNGSNVSISSFGTNTTLFGLLHLVIGSLTLYLFHPYIAIPLCFLPFWFYPERKVTTTITRENAATSLTMTGRFHGTSVMQCNGRVYINGIEVCEQETDPVDEADKEYRLEWAIDIDKESPCLLKKISQTGSGELVFESLILDDVVMIILNGSGDIVLPPYYDARPYQALTVQVTGSGYIHGSKSTAREVVLLLNGSGEINGFIARESASLSLTGSGTIYMVKYPHCNVTRFCTGSGTIRIRE